jgi:hypothetical protein
MQPLLTKIACSDRVDETELPLISKWVSAGSIPYLSMVWNSTYGACWLPAYKTLEQHKESERSSSL